MSIGAVPILSLVSYSKTVIEGGISGYFVAESSDLTARVSEFAASPAKLHYMACAARERFVIHSSPEEI